MSRCAVKQVVRSACSVLAVAGLTLPAIAVGSGTDEVSWELRQELSAPLAKKLRELREQKNDEGIKNKRGSFSRGFRKIDGNTYTTTMHIDTAEETKLTTERFEVTLSRDGKKWALTEEKKVDVFDGLRRQLGGRCYSFDSFSFDRYGMRMSSGPGGVCEWYFEGQVESMALVGSDMAYDYTAPKQQDFYTLQRIHQQEFEQEFVFPPKMFEFECDPETCEEILASAFTGLQRTPPSPDTPITESVATGEGIPQSLKDHVRKQHEKAKKRRRESPFSGFRLPDAPGNRWFWAIARKGENASVSIYYDNWSGFEVNFLVEMNRPDTGHFFSTVFGYYSDDTQNAHTPYELESRDDHVQNRVSLATDGVGFQSSRWHEVKSLHGTVEAALDDPELLKAEIDFGITIKQESKTLPFVIVSIPRQGAAGKNKPTSIRVNSIQLEGEEVTWVRTSPFGGYIVFPEPLPAGTLANIKMDFATRAIYKVNHAFSGMARFGWMPFVRFADFIDDFELTVKTPAQYKILGIGHKVSEQKDGETLITHWKADSPVVFPTIIFGKYESDDPGDYKATKMDGTEIPVAVHVDEVSMGQLDIAVNTFQQFKETIEDLDAGSRGIRGKQLRPIATQAAVAINLYREISGVDYPYGQLNLVNDPAPALYGQAPSSLIYLGSLVFRGEGTMAGGGLFGGGTGNTGTAKFLKSVVAHEVGHQWWGSRVSNANQRNYWFVESLAEFFSAIYLERVFGTKEYQEQVDEWRRVVLETDQKASVQNASSLFAGTDGFRSYQAAVYNKGPYAFHVMREIFGDETFFRFLKDFSQKLAAEREIVTRDIQMVAEEALGGVDENGNPYKVDLEWFFDQWIRGVGMPEYRLVYDTRRAEDGSGYIVEGTVYQRVVVGNKFKKTPLEGRYYRAVVPITALLKKNRESTTRLLIEGAETPFRFKVPERPVEVHLNYRGQTLSHDVVVNKSW